MAIEVAIGTLISRNPDIRGGRVHITGTGVTVRRIVGWYKLGLAPEDIVSEIPHLNLAQIHAALSYYHANQDEIEADIASEDAESERLEREQFLSRGPE